MRFGEAALYEEAINYLIPIEYPKAVEQAKIFRLLNQNSMWILKVLEKIKTSRLLQR